eukprot:TRINITY_DN28455_c1_g1_i7.p1 TRINITY_DN28455_c1_g1~~TRINITY_DN28455_c1_g1_i7.p1  ORF type:complete len:120 (-),score=27.25 TRINITY_DN28455_c1_g1_i7:191-550(-)
MERRLAEVVFSFVEELSKEEIAHSVLVQPGGRRVVVFPRRQEADKLHPWLQVDSYAAMGLLLCDRRAVFEETDWISVETALQSLALPPSGEVAVANALAAAGWRLSKAFRPKKTNVSDS